ncbi:MAG: magnesium transporter MgtE N-terminal domain-containing protein [Candidatus Dormibacteria bacterium]
MSDSAREEVARLPVSKLVKARLVDSRGDRLGQVDDIIVRLADGGYPPVTGLRARIGGRLLFVPSSRIADLHPNHVQLSGELLDLKQFERRPGEVLLRADVLSRRVIDVTTGRLVIANDIEIARVDGWWRIVAVDPTARGPLRRLLPGGQPAAHNVIDWSHIEPFVGHVPTSRLLLPLRRLKRLHPAQIADLVERVSHDEGDEIITAVGGDPGFEADVFEELDTHHQLEFLGQRSNQESAEILGEMAPDDAADLILELDQDRRAPILALLPPAHQRKVRSLLAYNPTTAGGMMIPDFVSVAESATVEQALGQIRRADKLPDEAASVVTITDAEHHLIGTVGVIDLLRAVPESRVLEVMEPVVARLRASADLEEVALLMSDYNLVALPVVDDNGQVIGVITVDDLLEALIPDDWRRRQSSEPT